MTQARYALEPLTRLFRRAHSLSQRLILELLCSTFELWQIPLKLLHPPNQPNPQNSNSLVQSQIKPNSQVEFVARDTEKSEFLDLVNFGGGAIVVETVITA